MSQWVTEGSLGSILFYSRIITETDIQKALVEQERSRCRFGEALVRLGIVTSEDINWALSHHLDIPYIRLNREEIGPDAATLLPEKIARRSRAVPVIRTDDELRVAIVDPLNREALREIEAACDRAVTISIASEEDVREMLDYLYGAELKGTFGLLSSVASAEEFAVMIADPAGECFLEWLLDLLARQGYRSVTLAPLSGGGLLSGSHGAAGRELGRLTSDACSRFVTLLRGRAAPRGIEGFAESGRLTHGCEGMTLTVDVHLLRGATGELVTLKQPEGIGGAPFPPKLTSRLRELTARPGLVVVSLPMEETRRVMEMLIDDQASGEQRALLLGEGNEALREKVLCIPLGARTDSTAVVTEALRHGPKLLLLEHAGDITSLLAAARAALRGVRVVAGTGVGIAETFALVVAAWRRHHLIPSALRGLVIGEAVPTLCASCRETLLLDAEEVDRLKLPPAPMGYRHATGCAACGYTGRGDTRLLAEVIPCDRTRANLLESCKIGDDFAEGPAHRGGETVREQAARLLVAGEISPETYLRAVTA